jgi:hypothetical protein
MTGPEQPADRLGPEPLHGEQPDEDHGRDRDHQVLQRRLDHLEASTAESTEIAGVMMLSPKNSDAPKIPSAASTRPSAGCGPRSAAVAARSAT